MENSRHKTRFAIAAIIVALALVGSHEARAADSGRFRVCFTKRCTTVDGDRLAVLVIVKVYERASDLEFGDRACVLNNNILLVRSSSLRAYIRKGAKCATAELSDYVDESNGRYWIEAGHSGDMTVSFDAASVNKSNGVATAWVRFLNPIRPSFEGEASWLTTWDVFCGRGQFIQRETFSYDASGAVLGTTTGSSAPVAMLPGTIAEAVSAGICGSF